MYSISSYSCAAVNNKMVYLILVVGCFIWYLTGKEAGLETSFAPHCHIK